MRPMIGPHDNGILARIRGEEVAEGSRRLPPAGEGQPARLSVEVDTLHNGRVLITYQLHHFKQRKTSYWAWGACRAVAVLY